MSERVAELQKRWSWIDPNGFENAAAAALVSQRTEEGLEQLRRAWGVAPTDVGVLLRFAVVVERTGQIHEANQ